MGNLRELFLSKQTLSEFVIRDKGRDQCAHFPLLTKLSIENCSGIHFLALNAPQLKHLAIDPRIVCLFQSFLKLRSVKKNEHRNLENLWITLRLIRMPKEELYFQYAQGRLATFEAEILFRIDQLKVDLKKQTNKYNSNPFKGYDPYTTEKFIVPLKTLTMNFECFEIEFNEYLNSFKSSLEKEGFPNKLNAIIFKQQIALLEEKLNGFDVELQIYEQKVKGFADRLRKFEETQVVLGRV